MKTDIHIIFFLLYFVYFNRNNKYLVGMVKNMAIRTERRIPVNRGCYGV